MRVFLKTVLTMVAAALLAGCDRAEKNGFLGSAVVESRTFSVATTAQGSILALFADEGQRVDKGDTLAVIDTVPLTLARQEVAAGISELAATKSAKEAEISALTADVAGIEREYSRIDGLVKKGSATEQQRDNLGTQLESARLRALAARRLLAALDEKEKGLRTRIASISDQVRRCLVKSPATGLVLTRYRSAGDVAGPGNPLFEIGAFDTLYADFFVPQPILGSLAHGQAVRVRIDGGEPENKEKETYLPGVITWIGSEAEFSPKNIQTRQSRNELVFRIRVTVPNSKGMLKRGLPVEIWK
jgi:HlyD family secretion protein